MLFEPPDPPDEEEFDDQRGDLFHGACATCGSRLHFLDGNEEGFWMACDTCLSMTCNAATQAETLTQWRTKNGT